MRQRYKPVNLVGLMGSLACIASLRDGMEKALISKYKPQKNEQHDLTLKQRAEEKRQRKLARNIKNAKA